MHHTRRQLLCIGAGWAAAPTLGMAQDTISAYPSSPVRLVAPFPAGSVFDAVGRKLADSLSARMKGSVVIDNKTGAGGAIGASEVLRAPPNGYTLLLTVADPLVTTPATMRVSYNPRTDFTPIMKLVRSYPVLLIHSSYKSTNLREFVEEARAASAPLTYGSFGTGSFPQLVMESVASKAGVKLTNVPYRGTPPAMNDMLANQITLAFTSVGQAGPLIAQGKARALAIMGPSRSPVLPQIATFAESGFDNFFTRRDSWLGLLGPAKMPADLVEKIRGHARAVLQDPEMLKWLATLDMSVDSGTSAAQFRADMDTEVLAVTKFIRDELKVQPQELNELQR
ncbi:Bug family tripartite tricarboxylate transporter substrate binding protein [Variovorax terrae]|uniref:Tripartite tricarboxylate transporter substrate binding protein n=1 Tax=Variovorax terrae TaxID=2923278 RepID=A0A9X1VWX0_9BURK|nr:tripartite tricarboxylate transporter substrate binding protein [Variovorax terrae]MCJ0764922.1 tripartite tricarboxylate transporter substrate binding protein [Variovorax terrae]